MGLPKEKVSLSDNKECGECVHLPAVRAYCPSVFEQEIPVPEGRRQLSSLSAAQGRVCRMFAGVPDISKAFSISHGMHVFG